MQPLSRPRAALPCRALGSHVRPTENNTEDAIMSPTPCRVDTDGWHCSLHSTPLLAQLRSSAWSKDEIEVEALESLPPPWAQRFMTKRSAYRHSSSW